MKINNSILERAVDQWGEIAQLEMLAEESLELALAVRKYIRALGSNRPLTNDHVIEEMADVIIMIEQIKQLVCKDKLQLIIDFKLDRLKRLLDGECRCRDFEEKEEG